MHIIFSTYELLWLFFLYSFLGWVLETITAAIRQKRFVNRGLVNLPFCLLYGSTAIFISIFAQELQGFWLFIASFILATLFEWVAGHFIEAIYHERWWDYSNVRWNLDGYICLPMSVLWGALGYLMITWGNNLLLTVFHFIPTIISTVLIWILSIAIGLDILATLVIISGKSQQTKNWEAIDRFLSKISFRLSEKIYERVHIRIQKAYPQSKPTVIEKTDATVFAAGCSFHKILWLFIIGAFLGDITETIYCRITAGYWMSRSSVVWGPFSIVWGLAIAAATVLLYKYQNKSDSFLFGVGAFLGGAYEYICSVFTELVFGKVFWDYSKIPFNLGGRINLLYCFFWGIAAVVWMKILYPKASSLIEKIPMKLGKILSWCLLIFMCCNIVVSCMALIRSTERAHDIPATASWQIIMDERFDDARLKQIYPNALATD